MARRLHPLTCTEIAERLDAALARRTEKEADETVSLVVVNAAELRDAIQSAVKDAIGDAFATLREEAKKEAAGDRLMSTVELAKYLGLAKGTISGWLCTGERKLPHIKVGGRPRFRKADIDVLLQGMVQNPFERLGDTQFFAPRRQQKMKWMK